MSIKKTLSILNLKEIEIEIYLLLLENKVMRAGEIAKKVSISRASVYDLLKRLIAKGLVIETRESGVKKFVVESPQKLELLIKDKEKEINSAKLGLADLQKIYKEKSAGFKPRLQIYEGEKELEQMMKDMLLHRDITVYAYWPIKRVMQLLSQDFLIKFHKERVERNIKI